MKKTKLQFVLKAFPIIVFINHALLSQTNVLPGNVSGTWTLANSPYKILGEIAIPNDSTLIIEPGVDVNFKGHYKLNVYGRLLAVGTREDTIRFRAADKQNGWHGIRFDSTPNTNDTSKFFYCSFKYGNANTGSGFDRCGGAMFIYGFDKVLVSHCLFDSNSQSGEGWDPPEADGGIYIYNASSRITYSTFSNNIGSKTSALGCVYSPNSIISNNVFFNNSGKYGAVAICYYSGGTLSGNLIYNNSATEAAGGLLVDNGATPMVTNNVIVHNQGFSGGVTCYRSGKPVLIGNTIAYNTASYGGGGIGCRFDGDPVLINNVLYGNTAPFGKEVGIDDDDSDPVLLYCNVQGGRTGFEGDGAGANYTGLYEHNIDADPLFVNAASSDYRLSDSSRCIAAGIDSIEVAGVWYKASQFCFNRNPRPSPDGTMPDIGACENLSGTNLNVFAQQPFINKMYARVNNDSVLFRTRFSNSADHHFTPHLICNNSGNTQIDSVYLYDDGMHGDSISNDGLYGGFIPPRTTEDYFKLSVSTFDHHNNEYYKTEELSRFTTVPLVFDNVQFAAITNHRYTFKPFLKNASTLHTIKNIMVTLSCNDAWVTAINPTQRSCVNLSPGQMAGITSAFAVTYDSASFLGYFNLRFSISSTDFSSWVIDTTIIVKLTDVKEESSLLLAYKLEQNFPNPLNPTTTIGFGIMEKGNVRLSVFNILGEEIKLLLNEEKEAGYHSIDFNASELPSGVYFYQLRAGSFAETRKMMLLR